MQAPTVTVSSAFQEHVSSLETMVDQTFALAGNHQVRIEAGAGGVRPYSRAPKQLRGSAHTPSVDKLYGPLVKAGLARIIRKKGCAPRVKFLRAA